MPASNLDPPQTTTNLASSPQIFANSHNFSVSGGTFRAESYHLHFSAPSVGEEDEDPTEDFRRIRWGDLDLRHLRLQTNHGPKDGKATATHVSRASRSMYAARVYGSTSDMSVAIYEGDKAQQDWIRAITEHAHFRSPAILQLFGTASRKGIYAAVFHDDLVPPEQMFQEPSMLATMYYRQYLMLEFLKVGKYVGQRMGISSVKSPMFTFWMRSSTRCLALEIFQGDLTYFLPQQFECQTRVGANPEPQMNPVAKDIPEMIKAFSIRDFLAACLPIRNRRQVIQSRVELNVVSRQQTRMELQLPIHALLSPMYAYEPVVRFSSAANFQRGQMYSWIGHSLSNDLRLMMRRGTGWSHVPYSRDSSAEERWQSFRISIDTDEWSARGYQDIETTWLAQAAYVFKELGVSRTRPEYSLPSSASCEVRLRSAHVPPLDTKVDAYLALCPYWEFLDGPLGLRVKRPERVAYWSLDPEASEPLVAAEALALGLPALEIQMHVYDHSWDDATYEAIVELCIAKGMDPHSLDMVLHLGLREGVILDSARGSMAGSINGSRKLD
ncbi:hypothetical protein MIND_01287200 [Mycena indigotica]|uniref:Uncharacterized protein n=1 Tax=Mycena indigotica TaxID=2126181 RepID=A0A8H6S180_9AGAR|nr:uncharacterized protein MIND_01287200 [Mycena indigotica]KAF7291425.1 hypothetical protein MIND_01287200 [Mycena indigotica]